jgi:hypothetical protein
MAMRNLHHQSQHHNRTPLLPSDFQHICFVIPSCVFCLHFGRRIIHPPAKPPFLIFACCHDCLVNRDPACSCACLFPLYHSFPPSRFLPFPLSLLPTYCNLATNPLSSTLTSINHQFFLPSSTFNLSSTSTNMTGRK